MNRAGIRRVVLALDALPLPVDARENLEVVLEVLGGRDLERGVVQSRPGVVRLLVEDSASGVDAAESDEGLSRSIRIDAVHIDAGVGVLVFAIDDRDVDRQLSRELRPVPEDPLVDERLMQVRIELVSAEGHRHRGSHDSGLENPVARGIVFIDLVGSRGVAEDGDRVATHDLFVEPSVAAADDVARVLGEQVGEARPGRDRGVVHPIDVEDIVVPLDEVRAQSEVQASAGDGASRNPLCRARSPAPAPRGSGASSDSGTGGETERFPPAGLFGSI